MEYLKTLAISAACSWTTFENVQSSWVTQGLKVLQMGLRFGGNDVGSVMLEENVVKAAGTANWHHGGGAAPHHSRRRLQARAARHACTRTLFLN